MALLIGPFHSSSGTFGETYVMARKKIGIDKLEVCNLSGKMSNLSVKLLLQRVKIDANSRKERSIEQKIIALKILMLNDMQFSITCDQVKVTRKTLYSWWKQYGEMMQNVEPDYVIAEAIETDIAVSTAEYIKKANKTGIKIMDMLEKLAEKASSPRQMLPLIEALKLTTEIIKLHIEMEQDEKDRPGGFFADLLELAIINGTHGK